jgi:methyl-accepting chemotaxis protein
MSKRLTVRSRAVITIVAVVLLFGTFAVSAVVFSEHIGPLIAQGAGFSVVVAALLWFFLARPAVKPLAQLAEVCDRLAVGDLTATMQASSDDEAGRALAAAERMKSALAGLVGELNHMSAEHDKGDIDVQVDAEKFHGGYRTMAQGVHGMVNNHISVKKKAMAVVKAIGEGDFDAPLEAFPGKKAFINETIEELRNTLKALIGELNHMSTEHDKGDIDVQIDAAKFQGGYRSMAQGVNDMVATPRRDHQGDAGHHRVRTGRLQRPA